MFEFLRCFSRECEKVWENHLKRLNKKSFEGERERCFSREFEKEWENHLKRFNKKSFERVFLREFENVWEHGEKNVFCLKFLLKNLSKNPV